jgi:hypothetical protein
MCPACDPLKAILAKQVTSHKYIHRYTLGFCSFYQVFILTIIPRITLAPGPPAPGYADGLPEHGCSALPPSVLRFPTDMLAIHQPLSM